MKSNMKKPVVLTTILVALIFSASGLAAAPRGTKTRAQCKAELNHCLYQTCKTGTSTAADTQCVNNCSRNGNACMMGAKPDKH